MKNLDEVATASKRFLDFYEAKDPDNALLATPNTTTTTTSSSSSRDQMHRNKSSSSLASSSNDLEVVLPADGGPGRSDQGYGVLEVATAATATASGSDAAAAGSVGGGSHVKVLAGASWLTQLRYGGSWGVGLYSKSVRVMPGCCTARRAV